MRLNRDLVVQSSVTVSWSGSGDLAVDPLAGAVYAAGGWYGAGRILKYNGSLAFISSTTYSGNVLGIAVDRTGEFIYVAGDGLSKYRSDLTFVSSAVISGSAADVKVAPDGTVLVVGVGPRALADLWIERRMADLTLLDSGTSRRRLTLVDWRTRLELDSAGNAYVLMISEVLAPATAIGFDSDLNVTTYFASDFDAIMGDLAWNPLNNHVYLSARRVVGIENETAIFELGVTAASKLDAAFAYPSPFSRRSAGGMTFVNLTPGAVVRIFSMGGVFVRELTATDLGTVTWDVRDGGGSRLSPGTYSAVASDGASRRSFNIMVVP